MKNGRSIGDDGAVLVFVAVLLVGLLAFISLAVDGGRAFVERRDVRNAADHAAMNAAWASCHGGSPQAAADTSVERNGFPKEQVLLTHLGDHTYRARVESSLTTGFAAIVGVNQLDVAGEATADCVEGSGSPGYAIFAGGHTCYDDGKVQIDIPGSDQLIMGNVHSNNNVRIGGANNDFRGADNPPPDTGPFEFTFVPDDSTPPINHDIDDFDPTNYATNNGNEYDTGYPAYDSVQLWPIGQPFQPGDADGHLAGSDLFWRGIAQANGTYYSGDIKADDMKSGGNYIDGVYFSENGNIELDHSDIGSAANPMEVTLIAKKGFIKITGSNQYLIPFTDPSIPDLTNNEYLAYAGIRKSGAARCDKFGITLSGSTSQWNGTLFAPRSLVEMNGSDNSTVDQGSLIGWAVRLNGQNITIRANDSGTVGGPDLQLLR